MDSEFEDFILGGDYNVRIRTDWNSSSYRFGRLAGKGPITIPPTNAIRGKLWIPPKEESATTVSPIAFPFQFMRLS